MKLGTVARRKWNNRHSVKKFEIKIKRIHKVKNLKNSGNYFKHDATSGVMLADKNKIGMFKAPTVFSLEHNREETLEFFKRLFEFFEDNKKTHQKMEVNINSSDVRIVTESTLMYLFAIIKDSSFSDFNVNGNHPKNKTAKESYKRLGFNKILKNFNGARYQDDHKLLLRGDDVSATMASEVFGFLKDDIGHEVNKKLYEAVVEMMSNTVQHAYKVEYILEKKWQIFVSKNTNGVRFVFLDTGMGIPDTVKKDYLEVVKRKYALLNNGVNAQVLKSAFCGDFRTRTEEGYRGKGLPQIKKFMTLRSIRNSAVYSGQAIGKEFESENPVFFEAKSNFYGTLYEFTLLRGDNYEKNNDINS